LTSRFVDWANTTLKTTVVIARKPVAQRQLRRTFAWT